MQKMPRCVVAIFTQAHCSDCNMLLFFLHYIIYEDGFGEIQNDLYNLRISQIIPMYYKVLKFFSLEKSRNRFLNVGNICRNEIIWVMQVAELQVRFCIKHFLLPPFTHHHSLRLLWNLSQGSGCVLAVVLVDIGCHNSTG